MLSSKEKHLTNEYLEQGFVIRPCEDLSHLDWIRSRFVEFSKHALSEKGSSHSDIWLNQIHEKISVVNLNNFRLNMIKAINMEAELRSRYFQLAKSLLESLVGNELAMQRRVNLSIQLPGDDSSLLPLHADVWSGDSPYEVVVWIPLVDCFKTKSMYILPPEKTTELHNRFADFSEKGSEAIFQEFEQDFHWVNVKYGEVLLFNQNLPHGNRVNVEGETRWSMNCRFKSVFSPYGQKKLGEFFEPITLRAATRVGMDYQLPKAR